MFNDSAVLSEVRVGGQVMAAVPLVKHEDAPSDSLDVCFEIGYGNLKMDRNMAITGDELVNRMSKGFQKFQLERVETLMAAMDCAVNTCSSIDEMRSLTAQILAEASAQLGAIV